MATKGEQFVEMFLDQENAPPEKQAQLCQLACQLAKEAQIDKAKAIAKAATKKSKSKADRSAVKAAKAAKAAEAAKAAKAAKAAVKAAKAAKPANVAGQPAK